LRSKGIAYSEIVRPLLTIAVLLIAASSPAMGEGATIYASPVVASPEDEIVVFYSGAAGFESDWIAIYSVEAANEDYGEWHYLRGAKSGNLTFTAPGEGGRYEFRMFENWAGGGGYNDIARSNVVTVEIEPVNPVKITASPLRVAPGGEITVGYSGAPGFETDWIAIYKAGAANEEYGQWHYLRGETSGTLTFTAPGEDGEYEFRMFENWAGGGGFSEIARSEMVYVGTSTA
jgi:hypothetical protein